MKKEDLIWLAGWLEGEGCFCFHKSNGSTTVEAGSTDLDIIRKVARLVDGRIENCTSYRKSNRKPFYRVRIFGTKSEKLMRSVLPFMGERRTAKILELLDFRASFKERKGKTSSDNWKDPVIRKRIEKGIKTAVLNTSPLERSRRAKKAWKTRKQNPNWKKALEPMFDSRRKENR